MPDKIKYFYEFEEFRLNLDDPSLWRGSELMSISPKALDVLVLLVQKKGEIVSREELIETVWKDIFVEEGNINYTISLLRKIFPNKELIKTVPRQGYRFNGEVREVSKNVRPTTQPPIRQSKPIAEKSPFRWVLALVSAVLVLSLVGFAYVSRIDNPAKASDIQPAHTSEAMQSYIRGKMILDSKSVENREEKATDEFQRAVMLDPTLAIAYAGLAEGFATSSVRMPYPKSRDAAAKARAAADKALALEPDLAEGYSARGWIKRNIDWDWVGAESDLRRSLELSPKNATAHQRLAATLSVLGRHDEALDEAKIAYELDPISETIIAARFPILEARGDYDIALQESEAISRENKTSIHAARAYATFLYHKRNFRDVIVIGEEAMRKNVGKAAFAWLSLLAASYHEIGEIDRSFEFLRQLEMLAPKDTKAQYSLAMNYAEIGRHDEALQALQDCLEKREERMSWIKNEPRFAALHETEGFLKILHEMKIP